MTRSVASELWSSAEIHSDRPALWARGEILTYEELFSQAARLAAALAVDMDVVPGDRVAFLANRTPMAYIALLSVVLAGATYVPLNPRFPAGRNRAILERADVKTLIVDDKNLRTVPEIFENLRALPRVLAPESTENLLERASWRGKECLPGKSMLSVPSALDESKPVYILFTSGSTGTPKGVPISHQNLLSYVRNIGELVGGVGSGDRIVQLADLTFDISVHDLFVSWLNGASVWSVPENASLMATRFVQDYKLTGWFSVPSTAGLLKQSGLLTPNSLPSLRFTLFCGEVLTGSVAEAWGAAALNSQIFNLYGPTEATVAFTGYQYHPGQEEPPQIVPLGIEYAEQSVGLFDTERPERVPAGETGELCLSGSQVTRGYWRAPDLNARRFFDAEGRQWYRTGDLGRWGGDELGYLFAGRVDHQVKIRGYRVELSEIEHVLRDLTSQDMVAVVAWPSTPEGGATGTVAFVAGDVGDATALRDACRERLPDYMVPSDILFPGALPLNQNGKVDYLKLRSALDAGEGAS